MKNKPKDESQMKSQLFEQDKMEKEGVAAVFCYKIVNPESRAEWRSLRQAGCHGGVSGQRRVQFPRWRCPPKVEKGGLS